MPKAFDPQIVNPIIAGIVEEVIATNGNLPSTKPFEVATKPIEEYEDRMRIKATDKFGVAVYIAAINFYLNKPDMQAHRARGAMIMYMDIEVADKLFKAAGFKVPYDEDDESMMGLCGNLCQTITNSFKERLAAAGYLSLEVSAPAVYKNNISEGVEFSKEQEEKQELSFFFLKHKALVIEWTMAPIPRK